MSKPRLLGVLLCYNDGDVLTDAIEYLLNANHDVVAWNHGSTDETGAVLERFRPHLVEATDIPRTVDFYDMYPLMSKHLRQNYVDRYDWISWPDQDEILEGPNRERSYADHLAEAFDSRHSWIESRDLVYWFTEADDVNCSSPCERIRHYSLARHGPPKIRSWRASATNIRWFNHNKAEGSRYPVMFNLRHYPMRSAAQMQRRLSVDRASLQRGPINFHYEHMKTVLPLLSVRPDDLWLDDGRSELNTEMKFNWSSIYGSAPRLPRDVAAAYLLSTKRWEVAEIIKASLERLPPDGFDALDRERIERWLRSLDGRIDCPVVVALKSDSVKLTTDRQAAEWNTDSLTDVDEAQPMVTDSATVALANATLTVTADAAARAAEVSLGPAGARHPPLVALVSCYKADAARVSRVENGLARFDALRPGYYYVACPPEAAW